MRDRMLEVNNFLAIGYMQCWAKLLFIKITKKYLAIMYIKITPTSKEKFRNNALGSTL